MLETIDNEKKLFCLIDSGGSHHFYHSKLSLATYGLIGEQQVQSVSGTLVAFGNRKIELPLDDNISGQTYHTPQLQTNNHSFRLLTRQ